MPERYKKVVLPATEDCQLIVWRFFRARTEKKSMTPPIAIAGIWRETIPAIKSRIDKTKNHDRHGIGFFCCLPDCMSGDRDEDVDVFLAPPIFVV